MNTPVDGNAAPVAVAPAIVIDAKTRWKQLIGAAKLNWPKLTELDLQKTDGIEHQLAVLVQGRYDIPRGDAYRQVRSFHEKHKV